MTLPVSMRAPRWRGRHFAADLRGASAVEFAILMPVLITIFFGIIETTDAISANRQTSLVASTVANLASQYTSVTSTDINNILGASSAVFGDFPTANATVTLSSVMVDANGNATVDWSVSKNGNPRSGNVTSTIPAGLLIPSTSVLWGEATYRYSPTLGYNITGTLQMYDQIYARPRQSSCVHYTGTC